MGKKLFKTLLKIAPAIIGSAVAGPAGAAIGSGVGTLASGGKIGQALLSAGGSYLGSSYLGGANIGPAGTIASGLGGLGLDSVANALPAELAGASLGGSAGGFLGSSLGENVGEGLGMGGQPNSKAAGPSPYSPNQNQMGSMPGSLSQFSGLDPNQQSTNIATQGVYGGGQGKDENEYFLNLINRKLVDNQGKTGSLDSLAPVEKSYLSQLGISGYDSPYELLRGISGYQQRA